MICVILPCDPIHKKKPDGEYLEEFNRIIAQYQIKEISTPYLSSNFNSHVLNNQTEGNFFN